MTQLIADMVGNGTGIALVASAIAFVGFLSAVSRLAAPRSVWKDGRR